MHPLLRRAESEFRRIQQQCFPWDPPPDLASIGASEHPASGDVIFTARLADGQSFRWRGGPHLEFMTGPAEIRSPHRCAQAMRELWDRVRATAPNPRDPPPMVAPPTDEALREEMMRPGYVEYYRGEYGGMTFRDDRLPRRGVLPLPPPPDMNVINELARRRDAMIEQAFYGGEVQSRRHSTVAPCNCPFCNPAFHTKAHAKSVALLREWLSPAQLAQYDKDRSFEVAAASGTRYRIREGVMQNVYKLDRDGREIVGLCFMPQGNLAVGDVMLAQKIALETDERAALKVAQRFGPTSPLSAYVP